MRSPATSRSGAPMAYREAACAAGRSVATAHRRAIAPVHPCRAAGVRISAEGATGVPARSGPHRRGPHRTRAASACRRGPRRYQRVIQAVPVPFVIIGHRVTIRLREPRSAQRRHDHPERPRVQRMASSPAQGQEDVAAPARPAVRRRPLDDLPADPRRSDAVPRDRHQARPRAARAARRRRHPAVPGPRRLRRRRTRPPASSTPSAPTSSSPSRRSARSWSTTSPSGCAASAAPSSRRSPTADEPSARALDGALRVDGWRSGRRRRRRRVDQPDGRGTPRRSADGPTRPAVARDLHLPRPSDPPQPSPGHDPDALHVRVSGTANARRLGRRRSHYSVAGLSAVAPGRRWTALALRSSLTHLEVRSLRCSRPPCQPRPCATNAVRLSRLDDAGLRWPLRSSLTHLRCARSGAPGRLASLAHARRTQFGCRAWTTRCCRLGPRAPAAILCLPVVRRRYDRDPAAGGGLEAVEGESCGAGAGRDANLAPDRSGVLSGAAAIRADRLVEELVAQDHARREIDVISRPNRRG